MIALIFLFSYKVLFVELINTQAYWHQSDFPFVWFENYPIIKANSSLISVIDLCGFRKPKVRELWCWQDQFYLSCQNVVYIHGFIAIKKGVRSSKEKKKLEILVETRLFAVQETQKTRKKKLIIAWNVSFSILPVCKKCDVKWSERSK